MLAISSSSSPSSPIYQSQDTPCLSHSHPHRQQQQQQQQHPRLSIMSRPLITFMNSLQSIESNSMELRHELTSIATLFDEWLMSQKSNIRSDNLLYTETLSKNAEWVTSLQGECQQGLQRKAALFAELEREQKELLEAEDALVDLHDRKNKTLQYQLELEKKSMDMISKIKREKEVEMQRNAQRQAQLIKEIPEWELYRRFLSFEIEAIRKDLMKFIYTNVDPDDWMREFYVVVDVSTDDYKIIECHPDLSIVQQHVDRLNEDRDFYAFLKRVRQSFVHHCPVISSSRS